MKQREPPSQLGDHEKTGIEGKDDAGSGSALSGSPSLLELFPDELLLYIAETSWNDLQMCLTVSKEENVMERTRNKRHSNPVYQLSLVNKRFRRVYLAYLFCNVSLEFGDGLYENHDSCLSPDLDELAAMRRAFCRYGHLAKYTRYVVLQCCNLKNLSSLPATQCLLFDILRLCPDLKRMYLPFGFGTWECRAPLLEAINNHPSADLRVIFGGFGYNEQLVPPPQSSSISLSRIIFNLHDIGYNFDWILPHLPAFIELGVQIEVEWISFIYVDDVRAWANLTTYLNLRLVHWGISEPRGWLELEELISRNKSLEKVVIHLAHYSLVESSTSISSLATDVHEQFPGPTSRIPSCLMDITVVHRRDQAVLTDSQPSRSNWTVSQISVRYDPSQNASRTLDEEEDDVCHLGEHLSEEDQKRLAELRRCLPVQLDALSLNCEHGNTYAVGHRNTETLNSIY
ncbi:hypothetical protein VKT23_007543 [Stygiomarasmius scandens]|uniref:F-box domain-containing protein n=1 Tax=Marasmiellus scandens TaxID=2682957 RepID=A0ABR1JNE8_9AGAR